MRSRGKVLLAISIALILLLLSIAVTFTFYDGGYRWRKLHDAVSKAVAHQFGWISFLLLIASTSYSLFKRISPKNIRIWLLMHCILGVTSIIFAWLHVIIGLWPIRPRDFLSLFALLLMTAIVASGLLGEFVKVKLVKSYWRDVHVPLTILLYLVLTVHILEKLALLR